MFEGKYKVMLSPQTEDKNSNQNYKGSEQLAAPQAKGIMGASSAPLYPSGLPTPLPDSRGIAIPLENLPGDSMAELPDEYRQAAADAAAFGMIFNF